MYDQHVQANAQGVVFATTSSWLRTPAGEDTSVGPTTRKEEKKKSLGSRLTPYRQ